MECPERKQKFIDYLDVLEQELSLPFNRETVGFQSHSISAKRYQSVETE